VYLTFKLILASRRDVCAVRLPPARSLEAHVESICARQVEARREDRASESNNDTAQRLDANLLCQQTIILLLALLVALTHESCTYMMPFTLCEVLAGPGARRAVE
jgi:hypothetical protein